MSGARLRVRAREAAISECTVPGKNLKLKTVKPFAVSTALSFHKSLHESALAHRRLKHTTPVRLVAGLVRAGVREDTETTNVGQKLRRELERPWL